ncbi:KGK domain protein [Nostoc sp. CHAB 5844]|nr:KGK domain protein [Nostoc sp. CHAB 5844]
MEYNSYLKESSDEEVLSFGTLLCKLGKFKQIIDRALSINFSKIINDEFKLEGLDLKVIKETGRRSDGQLKYNWVNPDWFTRDVECETLKMGAKGWQKGKFRIKITLEFCLDEPEIEQTSEITEPESPLDDLRRMIHEENS